MENFGSSNFQPTDEQINQWKELKNSEFNGPEKILDDAFGNIAVEILGIIEFNKKRGKSIAPRESFDQKLKECIGKLENLKSNMDEGLIQESNNIRRGFVQSLIDEAKNIHDASDENAIRALYQKYRLLRGLDK